MGTQAVDPKTVAPASKGKRKKRELNESSNKSADDTGNGGLGCSTRLAIGLMLFGFLIMFVFPPLGVVMLVLGVLIAVCGVVFGK